MLDKLYSLHPKLIDLSLNRVTRFLSDLGNPHLSLPPVIHVAGTNGKGSTVATLRAILEEHGFRCHVATSPHLVRLNERIVLAGEEIGNDALTALITECMDHNHGQDITFFEMIIAATFLAFSRTPADFCLLETGLGGRLDATNVVPQPAATIITAISYDHREFLGDTLPRIAAEKAGIMKPGTPCIIGRQPPMAESAAVRNTFLSHASSTGSPLLLNGADWRMEEEQSRLRFTDRQGTFLTQKPSLPGRHQFDNAGAAIAALRVIPGLRLDPEKISTALGKIHWPARLQKIEHPDFIETIGVGSELWLDGGHNDSAGMILADHIQGWCNTDAKPVHMIMGMLTRKNPVEFINPIVPYIESVTAIPVPGEESSFTPSELKARLAPLPLKAIHVSESVHDALHLLRRRHPGPKRILIAGSLYLAGHVLSAITKP